MIYFEIAFADRLAAAHRRHLDEAARAARCARLHNIHDRSRR